MKYMKNLNEIEVFKNADLKNFCTFKIGGKAKYVFIAKTTDALNKVFNYCKIHNIKFKIIGFGANLLFDDCGFNGAIIVNRASKILFRKNCVYADSGVAVSALISACAARGLGGIEKLAGIPSTVGGAVVNGLGAFGVEFNNFVEYVVCINDKGKIVKLKNSACGFGYRTSKFKQKNFIILRIKLKLNFADENEIKANMLSAFKQKSATQPLNYPSAGSVFKRFFVNKIENNNSYKDKTDKQDNLNYEYNNSNKDKIDVQIDKHDNLNAYNNSNKLYKIDKNYNCNDCKNNKIAQINLSYDYNNIYIDSYTDSLNEKPLFNSEQEIVPAKIIDELGLKGLKVGGAKVSTKHSGFIINTGNATSKDILNLIDLINQKVQATYGFTLPLEIEIVK